MSRPPRPAGSKSGRVSGHSAVRYRDRSVLVPYDADGKPYPYDALPVAGSARCTCGAVSDVLPTGNARSRWYIRHKEEAAVLAWSDNAAAERLIANA